MRGSTLSLSPFIYSCFNAESESLSGEITQRKVLLEKIKGEDKDVTKVLSQNYGNFKGPQNIMHLYVSSSGQE